jgi:hypothetical protein
MANTGSGKNNTFDKNGDENKPIELNYKGANGSTIIRTYNKPV